MTYHYLLRLNSHVIEICICHSADALCKWAIVSILKGVPRPNQYFCTQSMTAFSSVVGLFPYLSTSVDQESFTTILKKVRLQGSINKPPVQLFY